MIRRRSGHHRSKPPSKHCGRAVSLHPTSPPSASPINARPPSSGIARPASRSITPSFGRTAEHQISATKIRCASRRADHCKDRSRGRCLFLSEQDQMAARQYQWGPGTGRDWRSCIRHGRYMARLETDQRESPHHRSIERLTDDALQHQHPCVGRRATRHIRRSTSDPARGPLVVRDLRRDRNPPELRASRSPVSPATSRRPSSDKPVLTPARPRTHTAPAALCCRMLAISRSRRRTVCSRPSAGRSTDGPNMPSRAACLSAVP